ncbi:copper chaperone PCu(A)C [Luteimonas sp. RD2P54]|uniref:Copper chaperone PCu(A)C n=1 Tax=Luteimonas endophytica TaxID=3042023 RepID=A0ABT6J4X9_9GAMM|nr:copper chaperone PCu(A)C [Luteimonas endophytica]MDH5821617.1 copper chaperone PCu(A)C [Luteimonas endophytica]
MRVSRSWCPPKTGRFLAVVSLALAAAACSRSEAPDAAPRSTPDQVAGAPITAIEPWVREVPPGGRVAGGYLELENRGETDDRLVAVDSAAAARVEIHEMRHQDGMMRMRHLPEGLELPAGGRTALEPGGYHLMFIEPARRFAAGETVEATLRFERAPAVAVTFEVRGLGAGSATGDAD